MSHSLNKPNKKLHRTLGMEHVNHAIELMKSKPELVKKTIAVIQDENCLTRWELYRCVSNPRKIVCMQSEWKDNECIYMAPYGQMVLIAE